MAGVLCSMVGTTVAAAAGRTAKTITATGNAQVDTAQSKFGGASALFDGTNDRLTVTNISDMALGTGNFTIEFWMRQNSGTGNQVIYDQRPGSNGAYPYIGVDGGQLFIYIDGAYRVNRSATTAVSTGIWYHVAWVRNSGTSKLYRDGTEIGSFSDSFNYLAGNLNIGEYITNGFGYNGWLDEIRVSNSARYTAAFTSPTAAFTNDANTLLLIHANGADASTTFTDDNA